MTEDVFHSYQSLLNDIFSGDSDMSLEEFRERVEQAYDDDRLTGTQYDWLMGNSDI